MKANDPAKYTMYVYAIDHACYVTDLPSGKLSDLNGTIEVDMNKPLNFIELGLDIKTSNQYLKITGTDKMLVVKSVYVLENELQTKK